jgi:hypothetical protein
MTSKEQLHANVIHWVNVLEGNQDEIRDLYPPEEMDALTCSEYVTEHILDVEYTVSGSGDVLGASYLMAFGGSDRHTAWNRCRHLGTRQIRNSLH